MLRPACAILVSSAIAASPRSAHDLHKVDFSGGASGVDGGVPNKESTAEIRASNEPVSQAEVDAILRDMVESSKDDLGLPRGAPDVRLWGHEAENIRNDSVSPAEYHREEFSSEYVHRKGNTSVFILRGYGRKWAIKYHRHCETKWDPIDPIVVEAYFLSQLADMPDLTHKLLYYSTAIDEPQIEGKLRSVVRTCPNGQTPKVRYLLTERVGISVSAYASNRQGGRVDVGTAVKLGLQMMHLLRRLHEKKSFIHGDAHNANFAVSPKTGNLILIDFGRAKLVNPELDFPQGEKTLLPGVTSPEIECHLNLSQWENRQIKPSFRDDIYRVFTNMALLIHGEDLAHRIYQLCDGIEDAKARHSNSDQKLWEHFYMNFKEKRNMFNSQIVKFQSPRPQYLQTRYLNLADRIIGTRFDLEIDRMIELFQVAVNTLRKTTIAAKPDYATIIHAFEQILKLSDPEHEPNTRVKF